VHAQHPADPRQRRGDVGTAEQARPARVRIALHVVRVALAVAVPIELSIDEALVFVVRAGHGRIRFTNRALIDLPAGSHPIARISAADALRVTRPRPERPPLRPVTTALRTTPPHFQTVAGFVSPSGAQFVAR
jgi:hypothetical protein